MIANRRMMSARNNSPSVRQINGMRNARVRRGLREIVVTTGGLEDGSNGGASGLISRLNNSVFSESCSGLLVSASATESFSSWSVATKTCGVTYAIPHGALPNGEGLLVDRVCTGLTTHEPPERPTDRCN